MLKPRANTFFVELFTHLFCSTQLSTPLLSADPKDHPTTRNRGPIEEVFIKASRLQTLSLGLSFFLGENFASDAEHEESSFIEWAAKTALDTLRTGTDMVAGL